MHLHHIHTRHVALLGTLILALITLLAVLPELGTLDWSLGGGATVPEEPVAPVVAEPAWVGDPLAPVSLAR